MSNFWLVVCIGDATGLGLKLLHSLWKGFLKLEDLKIQRIGFKTRPKVPSKTKKIEIKIKDSFRNWEPNNIKNYMYVCKKILNVFEKHHMWLISLVEKRSTLYPLISVRSLPLLGGSRVKCPSLLHLVIHTCLTSQQHLSHACDR
jgi:hypothetical protein